MNKPNKIIIHHSATQDGLVLKDFDAIRNYHINNNGWRDIGYHYVIESINNEYKIITGRPEDTDGAHCPGQNTQSIGICLVGNFTNIEPPDAQLQTLVYLIKNIWNRYGKLPVYGHKDFHPTSCPGNKFPMLKLKSMLEGGINMLNFKDKEQISDWAKSHVERVVSFGIMNGVSEDTFDPKGTVTREQIAVIASNIVRYITGK